MSAISRQNRRTTTIHILALDGIVHVNSLFTFALFLGLAWYPTGAAASATIIDPSFSTCAVDVAENLIACNVYSFSCFLFSSLIASALKQAIKITNAGGKEAEVNGVAHASISRVNLSALRVGILVSRFGSAFGCGFLMMALVELVQIKLGSLGCGCFYSFAAIGPLAVLVPLALIIYLGLALYAFTR